METLSSEVRFEPIRLIARGGMGEVYEAHLHGVQGFSKTVAIKAIATEMADDPEFLDLFIGEAKLVADLVYQHIAQVYGLWRKGKMYYMVMEMVDGVSSADYVDQHIRVQKELPVELGAYIASRVARALEYAHDKKSRNGMPLGIVHRDVSPRNILLSWEGVVKLTDFGIAKAAQFMRSREGEILMGKAEYMSPEQAAYLPTDGRSDVFSLGVVAWELLTGRQLFAVDDVDETMNRVLGMPIPDVREYRPEVAEQLAAVISKSLERDPDERYQGAGQMALDLEQYMYGDRFGPTLVTLSKYLADIFGRPKTKILDRERPKD
ncbi:MAG: serine/threonine protein kinase [Planctomycetota bacterium]|jgi:serine/threonine-protein kinase